MRFWTILMVIVIAQGCRSSGVSSDTSTTAELPAPDDGLQGVWRLTDIEYVAADGSVEEGTPQESLLQFAAGYYFMGYSHHETRSQVFEDPWDPTPEEALNRASGLVVNAGRYERTETELVLYPEFAWYPVVVGSRAIIEPTVRGDTLILTYVDQIGVDGASDPYYEEGARYVLRLERLR